MHPDIALSVVEYVEAPRAVEVSHGEGNNNDVQEQFRELILKGKNIKEYFFRTFCVDYFDFGNSEINKLRKF